MEKHVKKIAEELTKIRRLLEKQGSTVNVVDGQEIRSMLEAQQKMERR